VRPPADIILHSRLTRALGTLYQFEVHASFGTPPQPAARGSLTLAAVDQQSRA
jgi:hypothetical protein